MTSVEGLGIDPIEPAHAAHQVRLRGFQQQVIVVVHQAEGIEHPALLGDFPGEQVDEGEAVCIVEKDGLAAIAAGGDVIDGAGEFQAERAGHEFTLRLRSYKVKN